MRDPDSSGNEPPDDEDPPDGGDLADRDDHRAGGAPPGVADLSDARARRNGKPRSNGKPSSDGNGASGGDPPGDADPPETNSHSATPSRRTPDPDQDIVELIQARKYDKALVMLMDRHENGVYRFCCSVIRNIKPNLVGIEQMAEDATLEAFVQARRDMSAFAGRSKIKSWLFAIARNRAIDETRISKVHTETVATDEVASPRIEDRGRTADMRISDLELTEALRGCLEALSEPEVTAILLRYQQAMPFEEMSEVTGEKPGTLQARVARAVEKVRRCIEGKTGGSL